MKIIVHGIRHSFKLTCGRCACVFEYDDYDVKRDTDDVSGHPYHYVECPECREELVIQWPPVIPKDREY
jgi:hypothetical protein